MRKPGDRIDGRLLKTLREGSGLTQEALAEQLGVKGGKSVISNWENGKAPCEGPAAELVLRLLGATTTDPEYVAQFAAMNAEWSRAEPGFRASWRQFSAIPENSLDVDAEAFGRLFPGVAIPSTQRVHGFPFIDVGGLPVYGIDAAGWSGSIPNERSQAPAYLWRFDRGGRFAYREHLWEFDSHSTTEGHIHLGAVLVLVLSGTHFLRGCADHLDCRDDASFVLRLHFGGIRNRGLAVFPESGPRDYGWLTPPTTRASSDEMSVRIATTIGRIRKDPTAVGLELALEFTLQLRPQTATIAALQRQLETQYLSDKTHGGYRWLGFLDAPGDDRKRHRPADTGR